VIRTPAAVHNTRRDVGTSRLRATRWSSPARGLPAAALAAAVGVWSATVAVFDIDPFFLPSPADTAAAFTRLPGPLLRETWATLLVTLTGFGIATAAGLAAAVLMAASRHVQAAVMPLLVAANSIPKIAVAPLLIAWLGFGFLPKMVMVVTICVFPIVINTASGLSATPADLTELARSLSAGARQTFVKIRLPWAVPQIFVGLKVGATLAIIGAVVAEIINPDRGLGAVVVHAGTSADTPLAFAAMTLLAAVSIGLYYSLAAAERLLLPWAPQQDGQ
jgi:NitT/TauT family transport system permease protein